MNDNKLLEPLTSAAGEVADLILATPVPPMTATTREEFVEAFGQFDKPAVKLLRERLSILRPEAAWADELGPVLPETGEVWVVDPIDGAVQFLQGLPQWSISVTLVRDRRPVVVVLHSPLLGEAYTAVAGHGARRNGKTIRPSAKTELKLCVLATSQPPTVATEPEAMERAGRSLTAVLPHAGAVRNLGPTSWQVADTAAGRLDAFWEFGRDDANLLGAALVAREAGALVTDIAGRGWEAGAGGFLVAPPALHRQLLTILDFGGPASS
jgi:myo-inositol-1(or 4)-monophosphatase